jgi:ferredoxin--NADP+ reductase
MPTFKVIENRSLTSDTFVLRTERPPQVIKAGQCFSVGTSSLGINREYSMYSGSDDHYLDFLIRKVADGRVSSKLHSLSPGELVEIGGPYGEFCLTETHIENKYLFIASGTGIAPFHSFVKTFPELKYEILHGVRHENEKYDFEAYQNGSYFPAISRPTKGGNGQRVTDLLLARDFDPKEKVYLCGNRSMIIDCVEILRNRGISGDSIFMETFF